MRHHARSRSPRKEEDGDERDRRHADHGLPVAERPPSNRDGRRLDKQAPRPASQEQAQHDQRRGVQRKGGCTCAQHHKQVVDSEVRAVLLDPGQSLLGDCMG